MRAPEFPDGSWFNVAAPLSLRELRGKIVLLDFWTFCCANCLHVIDELRALEAEFADELVIIGVHSPKFEHEKSDRAVAAAAERYGVAHPVFNDPRAAPVAAVRGAGLADAGADRPGRLRGRPGGRRGAGQRAAAG